MNTERRHAQGPRRARSAYSCVCNDDTETDAQIVEPEPTIVDVAKRAPAKRDGWRRAHSTRRATAPSGTLAIDRTVLISHSPAH
jgi:hypothetical protein